MKKKGGKFKMDRLTMSQSAGMKSNVKGTPKHGSGLAGKPNAPHQKLGGHSTKPNLYGWGESVSWSK